MLERQFMNVVRAFLVAALVAFFTAPATAQTFELINEYPATSVPGEADAFFAETVRPKTDGRVMIGRYLTQNPGCARAIKR
jgi:TRAP-type C4-dicarboxylate transport system substrate-binding protein